MIFRPSPAVTLLSAIFLFVFLSGCSGRETYEKRELAIEGRAGRVRFTAEIALSPAQHAQGLMYRKTLPDGEGMLFVFEKDQIVSFWMKNTLVPLSIAFIAYDGKILEIRNMEPGNLSAVKSSRFVRYALEVPLGWFERAGLAPGDRLDTNAL